MNIYKALNDITNYIEENLNNKIDYNTLCRFMGVNSYTMQRIFSLLANITLTDYIRKRRLSKAAGELASGAKVIDVAIKYGYESATSFSRAFEAFHNVKPSKINNSTKLKSFPRIVFEEKENIKNETEYEIIHLKALTLYGFKIKTSIETIGEDAPKFFKKIANKYENEYGEIKYAIVTYDETRTKCEYYYVLFENDIPTSEKIIIPESDYLVFYIDSQNPKDIQQKSQDFYLKFLPSCSFNLSPMPEIEYYHDDITEFLVPISLTDKTDN